MMPALTFMSMVFGGGGKVLFDLRVIHPNTQSYHNASTASITGCVQKKEYGDRICELELASFILLDLATTGGMEKEAITELLFK